MIGVTGATGGIGTRVLAGLLADPRRPEVCAVARDPSRLDYLASSCLNRRKADYDDRHALREAFAGLTSLIFISSDGPADAMLRHHENILAAALDGGIERIVYTSVIGLEAASPFYYRPVHQATETLLSETGLLVTIVRTSVFADFFMDSCVAPALATGVLELPGDGGRISFVSRDDVAACLVAAALSGQPGLLTATGPEALSIQAACEQISEATGVRLTHSPISSTAYAAGLGAQGRPRWLVDAYTTLFEAAGQDHFSAVSDGVWRLTGVWPLPLAQFARRRVGRWGVSNAHGRSTMSEARRRPRSSSPSSPYSW